MVQLTDSGDLTEIDDFFASDMEESYILWHNQYDVFLNQLSEELWNEYLEKVEKEPMQFYITDHILFVVLDMEKNLLYIYQTDL